MAGGDAGPMRALLVGGDRRSIAGGGRALALVRQKPALVAEVAALANDRDWLVAMRALDLLEKLAHQHPDWVAPHKRLFIGTLADSDKWEIRLQIVRALPLFEWSARQMRRVVAILLRDVGHPQKFVMAWALDSLATLATTTTPALLPAVQRHVRALEGLGSRALQARVRAIRARLARAR